MIVLMTSEGERIMQLTPILFVDAIEPCLDFWEKGLGFKRLGEVPGEDGLVFIMLGKGEAQVMYQTRNSLVDDLPDLAAALPDNCPSFLYLKVDDLEAVISGLDALGVEATVERRTTFYGADEISYREPGGHFVIFAHFAGEAHD
jgi:uncharacterized glyoxalase superfamily protein PhnB